MADRFSVLPREVVVKVLSHIGTPQEVVKCSYLSHEWREATNEEELWHELAQVKYGTHVAEATIHLYQGNWKGMLMDDNKQGAFPTIHMEKPCMWRYNDDADYQQTVFQREGLFYGCIITALQWDRVLGMLLVYIDARGESDLRHVMTSSFRYESEDGASAQMFRPRIWSNSIQETPGHYKGCMAFDQEGFRHEGRYDFCYANLIHGRADYESIPVLTSSLEMTNLSHYTLSGDLFQNETRQDELARWNKVLPEGFLEKRPEWWV